MASRDDELLNPAEQSAIRRKVPEGAGRLARCKWLAIAVIALYELQLHL